MTGIDVSQWQGNIDFTKVKAAGYDFVIIRAGYGQYVNQKDPYFEQNYNRASAAGLNVGVYWYSYADSIDAAKAEARTCLNVIKGKRFSIPIYFDLEETSQFNKGKSFCDAITVAFCTVIEAAGYFAGLYISRSPLQQYISSDVAKRYALWVAEYGTRCHYNGAIGIWQNSSTFAVPGVSGNVDHDICYVDYPTIIKNKGLNGYPKTKTNILESTGLKHGDRNDTVYAYKCLLRLAYNKGLVDIKVDDNNVFGDGTAKATDKLLSKFGYEPNGIAGPKLMQLITNKLLK